jgi:hypothetical protein
MRFGIFDKFGAGNSKPVFAAFRDGLDKLSLPHTTHDFAADVAVIWSVVWAGRMKQNHEVWQRFRSQGRPVIVLEVGMLDRGRTWKIAVNGTGSYAYHGHGLDLDRPRKLGIDLQPWRTQGDHVLICTQRTDSLQWQGQPDIVSWLSDLRDRLRLHSQRCLIVRPHPRQKIPTIPGLLLDTPRPVIGSYDDFDFDRGLESAWAVINHNSSPGVQAAIKGIASFVDASSLAAPVANLDLANIESPARPDRGAWLLQLCHTEWTLEEISTGWPMERLLRQLGSTI